DGGGRPLVWEELLEVPCRARARGGRETGASRQRVEDVLVAGQILGLLREPLEPSRREGLGGAEDEALDAVVQEGAPVCGERRALSEGEDGVQTYEIVAPLYERAQDGDEPAAGRFSETLVQQDLAQERPGARRGISRGQ